MKALRREEIWLNNTSLRDVDARIINIKLLEEAAAQDITWITFARGDGQIMAGRRRTGKTLTVQFMIRSLYDLAARCAVIDAVNAWAAQGGTLMWSARPEQRITVRAVDFVVPADIRDYNTPCQITFETGAVPYWEDAALSAYTGEGATGSGNLILRGNAPTWADVSAKGKAAALTGLSVTFGGSTILLSGFELASGETLRLWHDENGILRVDSEAAPYHFLQYRSAESADDLTGGPGKTAFSYTANTAVDFEIRARGRWL